MTNTTTPQTPKPYESYVKAMDELANVRDWNKKAADNRTGDDDKKVGDEFAKKLREYAYSQLDEGARPDSADLINQEQFENGLKEGQKRANVRVSYHFSKKLEELVTDIPKETLERLATVPDVVHAVPESDRKVFNAYYELASVKGIAQKFEEGKALSEGEGKMVTSLAMKGAGEMAANNLKASREEYANNEDVLNGARALAMISYKAGNVKPEKIKGYVKAGLDAEVKRLQDAYEAVAPKLGSNPDKEYKAALEMVRGAVKTMAKGDVDQSRKIQAIVYHAEKNDLASLYRRPSGQPSEDSEE